MVKITRYYDKYWDRETDVSRDDITTPERKRCLLENLGSYCRTGDQVLDLGCGAGMFTGWIKEAGYDVLGLDVSGKAIEMLKRNQPDVRCGLLNDDGTIPAKDDTFAAVWCTEVIEHVLEVDIFLKEINRVLKPGGILILTTPYHGLIKNLLIVLFKFDRHFKVEGSHIRFFNKRALACSFQSTGFNPLVYSGIGRCWPMYRSWFIVARKVVGNIQSAITSGNGGGR